HANIDPVTNKYFTRIGSEVFNFNDKLLGRDNSKDSGDGFDHRRMYSNEFINGIIRKEFGNKYSYHKGIESTWVEGVDSAVQPSYHYGKRHVEYHADLNAGPANMCPAEISESVEGLTTHKYGDVAEYIQGKHIEGRSEERRVGKEGTAGGGPADSTETTQTGAR